MTRYGLDFDQNEAAATVVTERRNLLIQPFKPTDRLSVGKAWREWLEEIEREFRYYRINTPNDKKDALLIFGGRELRRLDKYLPDLADNLDEYQKIRKKLNDYYVPRRNIYFERYLFLKMRPTPGERTVAYGTRLREKASECDFGDSCEDRILEHLIKTVDNQTLILKCIRKEWTLAEFLKRAGEMEDLSMQMSCMHTQRVKPKVARLERKIIKRGNYKARYRNIEDDLKTCGYCGLSGIHVKGSGCPAYGKRCFKCHARDHFAVVCKMKIYREENQQNSILNKNSTSQIDNEFKKSSEIQSKSIGNLKINVKKIRGINRTYQNTGQLTAKPTHSKVTDRRNVGVDRQVLQHLSKQKIKTQPIHGNYKLTRTNSNRRSDHSIAKNKRSTEELGQELDKCYNNNCHCFLTAMSEKQKNQNILSSFPTKRKTMARPITRAINFNMMVYHPV